MRIKEFLLKQEEQKIKTKTLAYLGKTRKDAEKKAKK